MKGSVDEPGAIVIPLPVGQRGDRAISPSVTSQGKAYGDCSHENARVNKQLRTVECRECGVTLDPVTVLLFMARSWDRYEMSIADLKRRAKYERAKLDDTKRLVRNAQAKLSRIKRKFKK